MDTTTPPTLGKSKKYLLIGIILAVLIAVCITVLLLVWWIYSRPFIEPIQPTVKVTQPFSAECEEPTSDYQSTKYRLKLLYPCALGRILVSEYKTTDCPAETESAIISFSSSYDFNIDVNKCNAGSFSAKIDEQYTLSSKDGTEFKVIIYTDPFNSASIKYFRITSDSRVQMRGSGIMQDKLAEFKSALKFVVENLEMEE